MVSLAGHLYAIGGTNGTTSLASTVRYDPTADKWEFMAQMSIGRCYVGAAVLGGKIYAVGGAATPAGPCNAPSICPKGPGADQPGARPRRQSPKGPRRLGVDHGPPTGSGGRGEEDVVGH